MKKLLFISLLASSCILSFSQARIERMKLVDKDDFTGKKTYALWNAIESSGCDFIAHSYPEDKLPKLYVRFGVRSDNWLDFNKILFKYTLNGKIIAREIGFNINDKKKIIQANSSGVCLEFVDIAATDELLSIFDEILDSKDIILRFEGTESYRNIKYYSYWLPPYKKVIDSYRKLQNDN